MSSKIDLMRLPMLKVFMMAVAIGLLSGGVCVAFMNVFPILPRWTPVFASILIGICAGGASIWLYARTKK